LPHASVKDVFAKLSVL